MEMNFTEEDRRLVERLTRRRKLRRDVMTIVLIACGIIILLYVTVFLRIPKKTELSLSKQALLITDNGIRETTVHIDGIYRESRMGADDGFHGQIVIEGINDRQVGEHDLRQIEPFSFTRTDANGPTGSLVCRYSENDFSPIGAIRMENGFESFVIWNSAGNDVVPRYVVIAPMEKALFTHDFLMRSDQSTAWARGTLFGWEYDLLNKKEPQ